MKAVVNPQSKKFWLAYPEGWVPIHGHEIAVDKYHFSAAPTEKGILVSEITTGMQVKVFPHNMLSAIMGATKEGSLDYYETIIGPELVSLIEINPNVDKILEDGHSQIKKLGIGNMPAIEDFDDRVLTEQVSEIQH